MGICNNSVFPLSSDKDEERSLSDTASIPKIKFYGFIKTDFVFDDSITNDPDATKFVLTEHNVLNDGQFSATVQNSRLGFDLRGPKAWDGEINGKA
jgi:hypothetical protein